MGFWTDKRVVVMGGAGFPGPCVLKELQDLAYKEILVPRSAEYDLAYVVKAFRTRHSLR